LLIGPTRELEVIGFIAGIQQIQRRPVRERINLPFR